MTFYNAAPTGQTIAAGTLLTGADGMQIVTDEEADIPAVSYPTLGQTTVTAHAIVTGPAGNIQGADMYGPCCRLNVSAVNSPFTGGQNARNYQEVSQQDIETAAANLKSSLTQSIQAALQTQVHADESQLTLPCQPTVSSDHRAGEEAAQVTVTVSETCTGIAYNGQAFHDLIMSQQEQQASSKLGAHYTLIGSIQTNVEHVTTSTQHITLQINSSSTWTYQFTQAQQQHLASLIAGKSKTEATTLLLHEYGVKSVSIPTDALPTTSSNIHLEFLQTL